MKRKQNVSFRGKMSYWLVMNMGPCERVTCEKMWKIPLVCAHPGEGKHGFRWTYSLRSVLMGENLTVGHSPPRVLQEGEWWLASPLTSCPEDHQAPCSCPGHVSSASQSAKVLMCVCLTEPLGGSGSWGFTLTGFPDTLRMDIHP